MNEHIKELLLKVVHMQGEDGEYLPSLVTEEHIEKFAELIVRECAQAFAAEVDTWKQMDPYQGSMKRKGTQAIKDRFGVE